MPRARRGRGLRGALALLLVIALVATGVPAVLAKTLTGTSRGDRLTGTRVADLIRGGGGGDTIAGRGGADRIFGGAGLDILSGDAGNDRIDGGAGNDEIRGGPGNDRLVGGPGRDALVGNSGVNQYFGGGGNDTVFAANGKPERVNCGAGTDTIRMDLRDQRVSCEKVAEVLPPWFHATYVGTGKHRHGPDGEVSFSWRSEWSTKDIKFFPSEPEPVESPDDLASPPMTFRFQRGACTDERTSRAFGTVYTRPLANGSWALRIFPIDGERAFDGPCGSWNFELIGAGSGDRPAMLGEFVLSPAQLRENPILVALRGGPFPGNGLAWQGRLEMRRAAG